MCFLRDRSEAEALAALALAEPFVEEGHIIAGEGTRLASTTRSQRFPGGLCLSVCAICALLTANVGFTRVPRS